MDDTNDSGAPSSDVTIPEGPRRAMPVSMLSTGGERLMSPKRSLELEVLSGQFPADLGGHMFVAGSIANPGRPAFSGEGTVYRIDFADDGVHFHQAVFRPPCFLVDQALQASNQGGLMGFHDLGLTRMSPLLGVRTVLSNSPVWLGDRMIITTDAGRPWEFDPITLELVTPIGKVDEWIGSIPAPWVFPLLLTSAHPAHDKETGEFFIANYANAGAGNTGFTHLIRWHNRGSLEHFQLVDHNGEPVIIEHCVHEVALTRNHVILQDSAFAVEMRQMAIDAVGLVLPGLPVRQLLGGNTMRAQRATTVLYMIPRAALRPKSGGVADHPTPVRVKRVEIPCESVHFFAQFDDDDELELIIPHTPTLDVSEWVHKGEEMLDGSVAGDTIAGMQIPCALTQGTLAIHKIDPKTGVLKDSRLTRNDCTWGLALGTFAPRPQAQRLEIMYFNTSGFAPELIPQRVLKAYQTRIDTDLLPLRTGASPKLLEFEVATGNIVSYECPHGWSLLSPTFIPRRGGCKGPRDGYLVCLAHAADCVPRARDTSGEELWVFDAADITAGPLCRLGHPGLDFAFTVHSTWVEHLKPSPRDYRVCIADDLCLDYVTHRSFGHLAFWDIFAAAARGALRHRAVAKLIADEVLPFFESSPR